MIPRLLVCATLLATCWHAAGDEILDPARYMDISEIRAGMKGYGLTVFQGVRTTKFRFEVVGVLISYRRPGHNAIIIRARDKFLKRTGIIAGMSGSPAYIKGRLIGALAFTWSFEKEPYGGITPIREMHEMLSLRSALTERFAGGTPSKTNERPRGSAPRWGKAVDFAGNQVAGAPALRWIQTPICVSGLPDAALKVMGDVIGGQNIMFVPGGAGVQGKTIKRGTPRIEPGSVVGVPIVSGDANAYGFGTVTEVLGDRILALGHPMFGLGKVDFPMSLGWVHGVMPSQVTSFKFGSPLSLVGRIVGDRPTGITGKVGHPPPTMPVKVKVQWGEGEWQRLYRFQVLDHPRFSGVLARSAILASALNRGDLPRDATLYGEARIRIDGEAPLHVSNLYSSDLSIGSLFDYANAVGTRVDTLLNNPVKRFRVTGVDAFLRIEERQRTAEVIAVRPEKGVVAPGETLNLIIDVQPVRDVMTSIIVSFKVPDAAPEGPARVYVVDAISRVNYERKDRPHRFLPRTARQLLELLAWEDDRTTLFLRLATKGGGAAINGHELPSLPTSVFAALYPPNVSGHSLVKQVFEARHKTPWVIKSNRQVPILIQQR